MKILQRHIGLTILTCVGSTLFIILGFNFIFAMLDEVTDLSANYQLLQAIQVVLLNLPTNLFDFLPASTLIGCLVGLGLLAQSNELTILRNTLSPLRLIVAVAQPVLVIILLGLVVVEEFAPRCEQLSEVIKQKAQGKYVTKDMQQALWIRDDLDFVFINHVTSDGALNGVRVFSHNDDLEMQRYLQAEKAHYEEGYWVLENVLQVDGLPDNPKRLQSSSLPWYNGLTPQFLQVQALPPSHLSMKELLLYSNYLGRQQMDSTEYRYALWDRLFQPFTCLSLMLLSFSFIFSSGRSVPIGTRVFQGIFVGVTLDILRDVLAQFAFSYQISPLFMVIAPIVVIAGVGGWLIYKKG